MSFLTTHPEALASAAGELQTIGASLNAQNVAAAGPITGLAPAAADEISMLQATQFSAYGTLYEQISAQAAAMQEMFVQTLRASGDSYGYTETANSAAAGLGTATAGLGAAGGAGSGVADPTFGLGGIASNSAILAAMNGANVGSAASVFSGLGTGFITNPSGVLNHAENVEVGNLVAQSTPGAVPVAASAGQGASNARMSAPPSWGTDAAPAAEAPRSTVAAGPAAAEPRGATTMPAGAPAVASSDRGYGFGRPRYGVKPVVMPRKPVV
ncbi:PPE family protein, SVP subgroup [[Mycobacterium] nativiensis]|uniref:PE domain-containing protein n=1 Tax=[Mycobacterium] nativiensis TaxID=2855503 RepID=A0ABU5XVS3_9MYCO|nr:PE domain-containing protein [Mycolicibacter sp. MYC340]MEB3031566.1 PE domain-containing protein [Mycolicibacter sp. MYC340]